MSAHTTGPLPTLTVPPTGTYGGPSFPRPKALLPHHRSVDITAFPPHSLLMADTPEAANGAPKLRASPPNRPLGTVRHSDKRTADPAIVLPRAVAAALGARTFSGPDNPLTIVEKLSLSRAIRMDVDEFRAQFREKLWTAADSMIDLIHRDRELLKPGERPFALSVLVDKANAIEGRNSAANASVNIQVNNFGPNALSKQDIISQLSGFTPGEQTTQKAVEPIYPQAAEKAVAISATLPATPLAQPPAT